MVDIVKQGMARGFGVVITNPGQSIWDEETKTAMSFTSWRAHKRGLNAVLDTNKNTVPTNETPEKHATYVFNFVLNEIAPGAQVDIIACGMAAYGLVCFLDDYCEYSDPSFEKVTRLITDQGLQGSTGRCAYVRSPWQSPRIHRSTSTIPASKTFSFA
jgi:hypothetical protein